MTLFIVIVIILQAQLMSMTFTVPEIRRFWPPLRSLETLHDNICFSQLDRFLERLMKIRTPIPSPPKTPISSSRSNIYFGFSFPALFM